MRRSLEYLQDVIASLLIVLVFILSLQAIWRLAWMAVRTAATDPEMLSEVMFVLILMEVYRLLIFYLREHRTGLWPSRSPSSTP